MKKILLLLLLLAMMPMYNNLIAQCVVKNVIVRVNSSIPSPTIAGACDINFDFIFTIEANGGNKYIYMHAWMANEYPNFFKCPPPPSNAKPPKASDLLLSRINIGIDNNVPVPALISSYVPDPTVPITPATSLLRSVYPTGDSARFEVRGIQITVPLGCDNIISMKADYWSSQSAQAQNAHCVYCNQSFTIDPRVNGFINCSTPRTFNAIISTVAPFTISGTYEVYLDNPSNPLVSGSIGTYGPEDNVRVYSSAFTTVIGGGVNRYIATDVTYLPYSNQKPDCDRNLWIVVQTNGYPNRAINLLVNGCAPLDLKLISFKAEKKNGNAVLQWQTEQEINMSGFYIERKVVNGQFENVGFVEAKSFRNNEGGGFVYSFTDAGLAVGNVTFYRLKMVEKDGKYAYSDIRAIRNDGKKMYVSIHPNPCNGSFIVAIPSDAGLYDVMLTDYSGKVLKTLNSLKNPSLQMDNLFPGVYMLKIFFRETGESVTERIIVQ